MPTINISPRKPVLALVLSAMLPGLGQLYNGQLNKGVFLFLVFVFITLPFIAFVALMLPPAWLLPLLVLSLIATLGLYVFALYDAWKVAQQRAEHRPYPWQQPAIYVSLLLFGYLSVLGGATHYVRGELIESFYIPSQSMLPNVLRGDIAVFIYPNNRAMLYINRIIGLPVVLELFRSEMPSALPGKSGFHIHMKRVFAGIGWGRCLNSLLYECTEKRSSTKKTRRII